MRIRRHRWCDAFLAGLGGIRGPSADGTDARFTKHFGRDTQLTPIPKKSLRPFSWFQRFGCGGMGVDLSEAFVGIVVQANGARFRELNDLGAQDCVIRCAM